MSSSTTICQYRSGHGAKNRAIVSRFALDLVRANKSTRSVKIRRKIRRLEPNYLLELLQLRGALTWIPSRWGWWG
jgi:hypothetical protein